MRERRRFKIVWRSHRNYAMLWYDNIVEIPRASLSLVAQGKLPKQHATNKITTIHNAKHS